MAQELTIHSIKNNTEQKANYDWNDMLTILDNVCCKVAERYDLYSGTQPRRAMIIEIISRNTCIACIDKQLRAKNSKRIDSIYKELHQLSCNLLVEELYCRLIKNGHKVNITTEANLKFGKADILIIPSYYGLSLHTNQKEIVVEVKSGFALSMPQVFRYLIDKNPRALVLWRIRNEQTLVFEKTKITQLLTQFVRMIVTRADRLLSAPKGQCKHAANSKAWSPTSQQIQETFSDFADAVVRTLPDVVETIITILEEKANNVEKC